MKNINIKNRIKRLKNEILKKGLDTIIIFSDENRRYLSGYTGENGSYAETAGFIVITKNQLILACDFRYYEQAQNETDFYTVILYKESFSKAVSDILQSVNAKKVGIESLGLTYYHYKEIKKQNSNNRLNIEVIAIDETLKFFRIKKDEYEIEIIKNALAIAETSFMQFKEKICKGMTEKQAAWILEKLMRENGADSMSFKVIAASGKNSAFPHAIPSKRKFNISEPLVFDFGTKLDGYCSDTTRTLVIKKPDDQFKQIYEIVFQAQKKAIDKIKPGVKASFIDKIAREYIDSTKFKGKFKHSLGHGVGMAIHEEPRLSRFNDMILKPEMVVTIEPGIYVPEWGGIRLENMIKITNHGAEVLNTMGYDNYIV
ncbi:MAG: hypothetical protein B6I26_01645 [Desulfobacteraceae bacterium 4572_130]|nr:MAG: hypothetical protein B6I26_01645 [Desulfobacteraceae bacterium 4572_130]